MLQLSDFVSIINDIMILIWFLFQAIYCYCKFISIFFEIDRKTEKQRKIFYLLICFLCDRHSQDWSRQKPEARNLLQVSHVTGAQACKSSPVVPSSVLAESWNAEQPTSGTVMCGTDVPRGSFMHCAKLHLHCRVHFVYFNFIELIYSL